MQNRTTAQSIVASLSLQPRLTPRFFGMGAVSSNRATMISLSMAGLLLKRSYPRPRFRATLHQAVESHVSENPRLRQRGKTHVCSQLHAHQRLARVVVMTFRNCSDDASKYGDQGNRPE
jgi:hypothetical protein